MNRFLLSCYIMTDACDVILANTIIIINNSTVINADLALVNSHALPRV